MPTGFEDLFDIERRPGAGVGLWTHAVERQLARVTEANLRHRLNVSPNEEEQKDDKSALEDLHADAYFLVLAIRRLLLFTDALIKQTEDPRLVEARALFDKRAPQAKTFRDFYEHLDEYLLDSPRKHVKEIQGRTAPILHSLWRYDNVRVSFGDRELDVSQAAKAAIELGKVGAEVWDKQLERVKRERDRIVELAPPDDGIPRAIELSMGISATVGGDEGTTEISVGSLIGVSVRKLTAEERQELESRPEESDEG